ncbi:hypothetical protein HN784_03545 [bacterium]|jgi:hypothetical protein|nr:hypothetical protein [bacterium]MBT4251370.1 hypothetical protein [bacterium]MBT4598249.1 hypothetical protein [bacterium]MBT6754082.1 hypothetical protein [bacterium]MBT7037902.1 hypothetical protein [bacterium]
MQEIPEKKNPEKKKENVVGKVVRDFMSGDYLKFKNAVQASFDSGEFIVGRGAFLRSVIGHAKLSSAEYAMCQKAIRMEISKIKKAEKKKAKEDSALMDETKHFERVQEQDKLMTDKARAKIMAGAAKKEWIDKAFYRRNGLEDPGDVGA